MHEFFHWFTADHITALGTVVAAASVWIAIVAINDGKYANANGWIRELDEKFYEKPELVLALFDKTKGIEEADAKLKAFVEYSADTWDFFLKHRFRVGQWDYSRLRYEVRIKFRRASARAPVDLRIDGLQLSWQKEIFRWFESSRPFRTYLESLVGTGTYGPGDSALGRVFVQWKLHWNRGDDHGGDLRAAAACLDEYIERLNSHRWEEIEPLIHDDAIFIFTEGTYQGKEAIGEACRRTFATIIDDRYEIANKTWSFVSPDWACCTYTFSWAGKVNGTTASGGGRGTSVVRRTASGWKIVHEHLGPHPKPAAES